MLNITNSNNNSSVQSVCSEDELNETNHLGKSACEYDGDDYNVEGLNYETNSYDGDQDDIEVDLEDDAESLKSPTSYSMSGHSLTANAANDNYFFKRNAKTKRGILPKNATNVMKKWLFQHIIVSELKNAEVFNWF